MESLRKLGVLATYVACGTYHNALITSEGEVVTWGSNVEGCLGRPKSMEAVSDPFTAEPGFVEGMGTVARGPVCSVACGREFTVLATLPYEGPDPMMMRKLKQTEDVKRLEEERAKQESKRRAEAESARAEQERRGLIKELNQGHLLCALDDACPGFYPDDLAPFTCSFCKHNKTDHVVPRQPDDPEMTLAKLRKQQQQVSPMGEW